MGPSSSANNDMNKGLQFRLSEGAEQPEHRTPPGPVRADTLAETDAQSLLQRLKPIKTEPTDEQEFAFRNRSLPPPLTGKTINDTFPSSDQHAGPGETTTGPLEVLRYAPEGDVPLAPHLTVTFSQPMVAVTSVEDLAARTVPVKLSPQPPGKWRWIGTKTVLFEPERRFPMATAYSVEVPAGVKSAVGDTLASPKKWTFATPPPTVKTSYPTNSPRRRDQIMFVEFDQKIDPGSVLGKIRVGAGRSDLKIRMATQSEIELDEEVLRLSKSAQEGRWLAFRAVSDAPDGTSLALPGAATITVSIGAGTPSLEGPLATTKPQGFTFQTYSPLKIEEVRCGYDGCRPLQPWSIRFNNPLDESSFKESQIRVEPEVPGVKVQIIGNVMVINGLTRGRTTYHLTIDGSIKDQFDQTLGKNAVETFNVLSAEPSLAAAKDGMVVLDPYGPARYSVFSTNYASLKVSLYSVAPEDWSKYYAFIRARQQYDNRDFPRQVPPGRLVLSKDMPIAGEPDQMTETAIDLSPALTNGHGQVVVVIEPPGPVNPKNQYRQMPIIAWVQATGIGLDAFVDGTDLIGWATSLKDGKPLEGVELVLLPVAGKGLSGKDGLARIALGPKQGTSAGTGMLVARKGGDVALLPEYMYWYGQESGWFKRSGQDFLRWFVFDDRGMYKPGEEVRVKGWIRLVGGGKDGDVGPLGSAAREIGYTVRDSRRNEVAKGSLSPNALGGFDTKFKLPDTMNLGNANLELKTLDAASTLGGQSFTHLFQVQEFRRPEFEVSASASEGPHIVGGHADVTVSASYYAGGGLPNAPVNWTVTATPGFFTPPNRREFTFGEWVPWWINRGGDSMTRTETFGGQTDAAGKHHLRIDFDSVHPPRAMSVRAEASVMDVNRQAWNASATLLVHPAELYVGLRSARTFVQPGEPLIVQSIVVDLDGKAIAGREVKMRAVLLDWIYKNGQWTQEEKDPQECSVKSAADPVQCRFQPKQGGTYRVTATIMDDRERVNQSALTLWVAGGKTPPKRDVEQEDAPLIPDRKDYQPGDTAEILVQSPFFPAEGVLTLRRSGVVSTERFTMSGPSHTLKVPIRESYIPNVEIEVDLNGAADRATDTDAGLTADKAKSLPKRPGFAVGTLNLSVPPLARKLTVTANPAATKIEPGGETMVEVEVKDAGGKPVAGSELALVVVDESILALSSYKMADPLGVFYTNRSADTSDYHSRQQVLLASATDLVSRFQSGGVRGGVGQGAGPLRAMPPPSPGAPMAGRAMSAMIVTKEGTNDLAGGQQQQIQIRENFNALATFAATVPTDENGRASVKVKLPDNLTRYRVMAVGVAGGKEFGYGESSITARLPLMVRPSPPRFLNFGDKFELPIVVQNQTDAPMDVNIAVRASNAELTGGSGRKVTVPANDRVEVQIPAAAVRAGTARFQIAAASGRWDDAAEVEFPVWTPATTEAFATYGDIDNGAIAQPVDAPSNVVKQFGGLEVTTSSTQLQALTDAFLYLVVYPYECSEQLSSRILAVAALRDVLTAFNAKGLPKPEEMTAAVDRDITRLRAMQNGDGGFGFWRRGDDSWPYLSIHVAHALERAREKKFDVPPQMLELSKQYLRNIDSHIPDYYGAYARRALESYALYVRNLMGDRDPAKARAVIAEAGLEGLSLESIGWLLPVLSGDAASSANVTAIRQYLNNRAEETAGTAHFTTSYGDGDHLLLSSSRRADGVILDALIGDQPNSDLIPKIVRGLLAHRTEGRWGNTQENAFVLLALDRYFATYEKVTPDFVARAWLGNGYAGEQQFRGRSTDSHKLSIPMRYLAETAATQNLVLSKDGPGRLYYRIGMQYAPASLKLDAADYGFTVQREYEAIDNASDVARDDNGVWHIKAGAKVRVRLTLVAPTRRYHVALVDPIPAGLEPMNPELATTGSIPQDPKQEATAPRWWWWSRPWYEHQNLRDERAEAFTSLLWEGVYNYSYVARATTPGTFVVPPSKAEEMYHPETFGRGATDRVVVE